MIKNKERYELIDILKFTFAIFIVALHTNTTSNFQTNLYEYYIQHFFFRMAVPFFFMTSGFFFYKGIKDNNINEHSKKQIKRLLIPFIFWLIIGVPYEILKYNDNRIIYVFAKLLRKIVFYPWSALWFILALIIAIIIENYILQKNKIKESFIICIILYIIALFGNSYYFLIDGTIFGKLMDYYLKICITTRNGLFVGLPLFNIGVIIARHQSKIITTSNKKIFLYLIVFALLYLFEITLIRNFDYIKDDHSLFIITIPFISFILITCIKLKNIHFKFDTVKLRNLSTGIYFTHKSTYYYINLFTNNVFSSYKYFLITSFICITTCLILYKINNKYINYMIK